MLLPDGWPLEWLALCALALLAQWPLRRALRWLVGPLFAWEVVRLARRGSTTWLRVAYAAALLLTLYASFPTYAEADSTEIARFATDFSDRFLSVQAITVLLAVPLYFSGAVSDEKEKRSLDFLLTSPLSAREIILGKYFARVLSLAGVLLTGLPILALTMLWGGVDLLHVGIAFAGTFLSLLSLGAICVLCSVLFNRAVTATACAIVAMVFGLSCWWPRKLHPNLLPPIPGAPGGPAWELQLLRDDAIGHLTVSLVVLLLAMRLLRRRANPPEPYPSIARTNDVTDQPPVVARPEWARLTFWRPIGRDALLWKERHAGHRAEPFSEALWLYFAGMLATLSFVAFFSGIEQLRDILAGVYYFVLALLTFGLAVGLLLHLAGAITREREQRTLEPLLTLPASRGQILRSKWLGAVLRRGRWLVAIAVMLLVGLLSGTLSWAAAAALAALIAAQAALVAALSLFASIVSRNTVRAYLTTLVALVVLTVATGVVAKFDASMHYFYPDRPRWPLAEALNPAMAWQVAYRLNAARGDERLMTFTSLLAAAGVYIAASAGLGLAGLWRFRRTERYA